MLSSHRVLVLDYIKTNISRQCDVNQEAAEKISNLLMDYQAKLKDLDEVLKLAGDTVKKANTQNGLNAVALEDLLVRPSHKNRHQNSHMTHHGPLPCTPNLEHKAPLCTSLNS